MFKNEQILNGAVLKVKPAQLVKIGNKEYFLTVEQESYLDKTLDRMPYGIVDKKITGIGATTLELTSFRNSIIVVPTKALAETKCNKHGAFYVGSSTSLMKSPSLFLIRRYVHDILKPNIRNKKIVVVADSLHKVLNAIGEEHYHKWFLMIDEVDVIQSDSTYRPALENAIDWYLRFPKENRCLVTATYRNFSHPMLKKEYKTTIYYPKMPVRNVKLYHTDNPNVMTKNVIEMISRISSQEKIVIAYNSITENMVIINMLSSEMRTECGFLCSEKSIKRAMEYYTEMKNGKLTKRITFMTCAYFVGVDIYDRFHLISVSNNCQDYALLSVNKIIQIAGRCRDKAGLFSHTVIYNTDVLPFEKDPEQNDFLIYEPIYKRFHTYPNFIYDRLYVVEKTIRAK